MNALSINRTSQKLQSIASDDETRGGITGVHFNDRHVVATNGHMLVMRKRDADEPSGVTLNFDTASPKGKDPVFSYVELPATKRLVNETTGGKAEINPYNYPDYAQVLPKGYHEQNTTTVCIDAKYLLDLAKVLMTRAKDARVTLSIPHDGRGPIVVCGDDTNAVGILMPCKVSASPISTLETLR